MRDGVALNIHQKRHALVLPTEISLLPNLECYVKYPGTCPITKLKMELETPQQAAAAFKIHEVKTKIMYEENEKLHDKEMIDV